MKSETMQTNSPWPKFSEPLRRTLTRNGAIAAGVGAGLAVVRHEPSLFLPFAVLALWPALGGHCVELAFLNGLRPRLPASRLAQTAARLLVWFVGGALLYLCMALTTRVLPVKALPVEYWWCGGLGFIGIELVAHTALAVRGCPSFYNGRG